MNGHQEYRYTSQCGMQAIVVSRQPHQLGHKSSTDKITQQPQAESDHMPAFQTSLYPLAPDTYRIKNQGHRNNNDSR